MGMGISTSVTLERQTADNQVEPITAERIHATITRDDRVWDRMTGKYRSYREAYAIEFLLELGRRGVEDPNLEAELVLAAQITAEDHVYAIRILDGGLEEAING